MKKKARKPRRYWIVLAESGYPMAVADAPVRKEFYDNWNHFSAPHKVIRVEEVIPKGKKR